MKKVFDVRDPEKPPAKGEPRGTVNFELKLTFSGDSVVAKVEPPAAESPDISATDSKNGAGDG